MAIDPPDIYVRAPPSLSPPVSSRSSRFFWLLAEICSRMTLVSSPFFLHSKGSRDKDLLFSRIWATIEDVRTVSNSSSWSVDGFRPRLPLCISPLEEENISEDRRREVR
ncbi:hypothetical protein EYF80_028307 [Liparis tanakae]|uniref:Uncharacterized protein n=1 Tax=Liparis tanakae TaxID=230148 RepID=A0A4Z2H6A7_9TELE|nr:hypothetical protein EYF80_028307 [Liparis tanakae]